ncbi:FAD binding domain-containing protein [Salsipaludibacter albus]|uniref:FAD binding domain-containing protein n=1 Tax=Salsipaludibacter albus TaxID=2849650 RepID=UPI001EE474B4|nr:xanthine dehydrogenase family protein subunit M [Salsipaludibacter albus]MBY5162180.1 xanthine dehydrogenase family protein subunit M [Salsipaludibacter albus]
MQVPETFDYERASTVEDAIQRLTAHGDEARVIAGGHSLLPMMKLRLAVPEVLIDINDLPGLDHVRLDGDELAIGALVRHAAILDDPILGEHYPIFADAERKIADPLVRNRGTIGGSLCQADPAEDLSAVVTALKGSCVIQSANGRRTVPMREFHTGPWETAVGDAELLVEVRIPVRTSVGSSYHKVERRVGDWAVAAAGAFVQLDGDTIAAVGLGLSAVGAPDMTCPDAEQALVGGPASAEAFAEAARIVHDAVSPTADQRGPVDYKRHLAGELTRRALTDAARRARSGSDPVDSEEGNA